MRKWKALAGFTLTFVLVWSAAAFAHFQMFYTPESALTNEDSKEINLKLIFTHPFEANYTMDMGKDMEGNTHPPKAVGVMHNGEKTDLLDKIRPIEFASLTNKGKAYELSYNLDGEGDFIFYCDPDYYWEPAEDCFIRHVTKVIVNRGGMSTDWDQPVGLDVEIIPLDKPYGVWAGNVFRGVVMVKKDGKLVPFPNAEIEVEYVSRDIIGNGFAKQAKVGEAPQDCFVTQTIKANKDGEFAYGIPRAGWWGFAALGLTEEKKNGKDIELGALIWVQAHEMK